MSSFLGDYAEDATIDFTFHTTDTSAVPATLAGTPVVSVYKANGATESTAGVTLTVDFDGKTGLNQVRVDLSADAFYSVTNDYSVVITTGTVDSVSVVGATLKTFSIENRFEEAENAIVENFLDRIFKVDYDPGSIPGVSGAWANEAVEDDGQGAMRFTAKMVETVQSSGGGFISDVWRWSTSTAETDPGNGFIRGNNAVFANITEVFISSISNTSKQFSAIIEALDTGDRLVLGREGASENFIILNLTGPAVSNDGGDWYSIPGTVVDSGGSFGANNTIDTMFAFQSDSAAVIASAVWAALRAANQVADSFGEFVLADLVRIVDDAVSAANLKLGWDGATGVIGDTFPSRQDQVDNLSAGSGGGQTRAATGVVTTTVGTEVGTFADTEALDGTVHSYEPSGGVTDFFYTFNVGNTGVATQIILNFNADSNGDTYRLYGFKFSTSSFIQIGTLNGTNMSTITPTLQPIIMTANMTDDNGDVRFRIESTDGTLIETDRVLVEFVNIAAEAFIFTSGTAQSGGPNTIQIEGGTVTIDDQFVRARVLLTAGTGAGQEGIIASSTAVDDTIIVSADWVINPDSTTEYVISPGQAHASTQNGSYDGQVFFNNNPGKGFAGRLVNVNGTSTHPSNNEADTFALAADPQINTNVIQVATGSTFTLPSNSSNKNFEGVGWFLVLNNQDITSSLFDGCSTVTGTAIGSGAAFFNGAFSGVTLDPCSGLTMGFEGGTTFTIGTPGAFTFGNVGGIGNTPGIIDFGVGNNSSEFSLQDVTGGIIEIQNAGDGTGNYLLSMNGVGDLIVNANCSATTTVKLEGHIKRNADVTGIVYEEAANVVSLVDLGSGQTIGDNLSDMAGATFDTSTDSLEAIRNQGDFAWITAVGFSTHTAAAVRVEMDDNSTKLAAILADTDELQTDWENDGRLDVILDAVKVKTDQLTFTSGNNVDSNPLEINSSNLAAVRLALSAGEIIPATVDTITNGFPPTTTDFQTDITEATADHFNGRSIIWTSGVLKGQATSITDYVLVGTIGQFTVVAMTEPPANNDTFIIV